MRVSEAVRIRFFELMEEKNFKQYDFYKKGGIAKSTTSQVLNGAHERIALLTIYEMINTMGISFKEFFDDKIFDEINVWITIVNHKEKFPLRDKRGEII